MKENTMEELANRAWDVASVYAEKLGVTISGDDDDEEFYSASTSIAILETVIQFFEDIL